MLRIDRSLLAIVQARMSSRRFPGKVLAPFLGRPLVVHVVDALRRAVPDARVVVATSDDPSDDPLAAYLASGSVTVFRGPLDDVFERFRQCVTRYPAEWLLRVSADSPMLDPAVIARVVERAADGVDLVTTIFPRTFPRGANAEVLRVSTMMAIDRAELSAADREHVTQIYYRQPERFRIENVESGQPALAESSVAVDTVEDLHRLEREVAERKQPA
jgi:spore coat polysaccharide biosynthesis protein SpsF